MFDFGQRDRCLVHVQVQVRKLYQDFRGSRTHLQSRAQFILGFGQPAITHIRERRIKMSDRVFWLKPLSQQELLACAGKIGVAEVSGAKQQVLIHIRRTESHAPGGVILCRIVFPQIEMQFGQLMKSGLHVRVQCQSALQLGFGLCIILAVGKSNAQIVVGFGRVGSFCGLFPQFRNSTAQILVGQQDTRVGDMRTNIVWVLAQNCIIQRRCLRDISAA